MANTEITLEVTTDQLQIDIIEEDIHFEFDEGRRGEKGDSANQEPAGIEGSIQFNKANVFAGSDELTWNDTTKQLRIKGDIVIKSGRKLILDGI
jgi:hypothetical protein